MRKIRILAVLLLSPVLLLAVPSSVGAQPPPSTVTVTVAADSVLLDPTLVRVPITVTCAPMEVRDVQSNSEMRQAVSATQIARGFGFVENRAIVCDGEPHANSVLIWADPTGAPFAKGTATVQVPMTLCTPSFTCQSSPFGIHITHVGRAAAAGESGE